MARAVQQGQLLVEEEKEKMDSTTTATKDDQQTKIEFKQLYDDLVLDMAARWREFGTMLGLNKCLNEIEGEANRCQNCLLTIIEAWLSMETPHTKKVLVEVLNSKSVGEERLAAKVEKNTDIPKEFKVGEDEPILAETLSSVASKYTALGIQLGVDNEMIKEIESRVKNVRSYLHELLNRWHKKEQPLSKILVALRSRPVGNARLAGELEKKWSRFLNPSSEPVADPSITCSAEETNIR